MLRQRVVEFLGNLVQLPQTRPRHRREIMVLVVQPDIVREEVQRAVVRERLRRRRQLHGGGRRGVTGLWWLPLEDVVLGDEVASAGVQRAGEERRREKVIEGVPAPHLDEGVVEGKLHDDVEQVDLGDGQLVDEHGSQRIEEDLEGREERLAEDRIEEDGFECSREVGVKAVDAKGLVMREVVRLSCGELLAICIRQLYGSLFEASNMALSII